MEPTKIAAHDKAGTEGLLGSTEQEFTGDTESFIAERIPRSSAPVGTRAKAVPTDLKPDGGHFTAGVGVTAFRTGA